MFEHKVKLYWVVPSSQTNYPIFIIDDILLSCKLILIKTKFCCPTKRIIKLFLIANEHQWSTCTDEKYLWEVYTYRVDYGQYLLTGTVLWTDPCWTEICGINIHPDFMFVANVNNFRCQVNSSTQSWSIRCTKPEWNQPILNVFFQQLFKMAHINHIIFSHLTVIGSDCSSIVNFLQQQSPLSTIVGNFTVITNKL